MLSYSQLQKRYRELSVNSKYRVRKFGEDEWDIAYLVLRIGGPKLLHVLHATHGLPASRSVQSHTRKDSCISAAVDTSFENRIIQNKNNGTFNETSDSIKTLKMDGIATESSLRWCSKENKIIGLCYQHSHDINISLNRLDDALKIKDLLDSDRIHKTGNFIMVQASFFACVLLKRKGGGKLYLYQLGTDQEDTLFSSVRTITHARNCDAL